MIPEPIIAILQEAQHRTEKVRECYGILLPDRCEAWHPIPFFGPVNNASLLTVAMNPSADEFRGRQWPVRMSSAELGMRLLQYFDSPIKPHPWFSMANLPFQAMGLCYGKGMAHLDVVCRATQTINLHNFEHFLDLADAEADLFFRILEQAKSAEVIVLSGSVTKLRYVHEHVARHAARLGHRFSPKPTRPGGAFTARHELRLPERTIAVLFTSSSVNHRQGPERYYEMIRSHEAWLRGMLTNRGHE